MTICNSIYEKLNKYEYECLINIKYSHHCIELPPFSATDFKNININDKNELYKLRKKCELYLNDLNINKDDLIQVFNGVLQKLSK